MKNILINIILFCIGLSSNLVFAGESTIPLAKEARLPSNDLVFNQKTLTSKEAKDLKEIDLSELEPSENEIYDGKNHLNESENNVSVQDNEVLRFQGALMSNSGLLRFNAINETDGSLLTLHLDKTLHSMLLRKNLLRRLGYKIPTIKYFPRVSITFNSLEEKTDFLKRIIPENTLGAAERWIVENNDLTIKLQDVAVSKPDESDFYNVSMGVPADSINSRTIRGIVGAYALVDLGESVPQFSWSAGKIDNNAVALTHFTGNEFNSSIDDIVWMQKKIANLTREEILTIVKLSSFPSGVAEVVAEKIISRRNTLNQILNIKKANLDVNMKLNIPGIVVDGKITPQNFQGYASRFTYGDAETPFDQMRFYFYSKLESNAIDNAITYLNKNLEGYDVNTVRTDYFKKQFDAGLKHFVDTGELLPIQVGHWTSPVANLRLILSRDIVIGNYLGTDNLVQLADTFGGSLNLGMLVGYEGLPYGVSASVSGTVSLVRTFTHLKPVKSLKASLKEPFKNLLVPLIKKSLRDDFFTLNELKDFKGPSVDRNKKILEIMKNIDENLNVGESLIMTDRVMPSVSLDLNYTQGVVGAGVGVTGSVAVIKRIHLYKKAPQVLQIFDDSGHTKTLDLSLNINAAGYPVLKILQTYEKGNYNIKSYMVSLNSNPDENPNLYSNALAVYEILKSKNFELINSTITPVTLDASYTDQSTGFSFLLWKVKKLKGQTFFDVKAKDGVNGKYFSYQKDFLTGANIESISKEILNKYLQDKVDPNISITNESGKNPGETIYGKSHTETFRFEAAIDEGNKLSKKFLTLVDIRQGWTFSEKSLIKFIENVNQKFNFNLFNREQIDFKKLRLYKIGYHLNLYEAGIIKLETITNNDISKIEEIYIQNARCNSIGESGPDMSVRCGYLTALKSKLYSCDKKINMSTDHAVCLTELFERLYLDLKFEDFKKLIGENNFYLYGSVDGFRTNSEILNDTIYSNSFGKIGSPYWNGPFDVVRSLVGLSDGEFAGGWLRGGL
jgi:hypothetical protein